MLIQFILAFLDQLQKDKKSYAHVSGLAHRTAIFEGAEFDLIFDERPKSVIATANSFSENKMFLKTNNVLSKVLKLQCSYRSARSP